MVAMVGGGLVSAMFGDPIKRMYTDVLHQEY